MGMTRQQAEALTVTITEVLCHNREKLAESYVSKAALEKVGLLLTDCIATIHRYNNKATHLGANPDWVLRM
jgi:hypothetical protein